MPTRIPSRVGILERRQRIRKALALVAALVLYRAGFGATAMSGSKSTFIFVGGTVKPPDEPPAPVQPSE